MDSKLYKPEAIKPDTRTSEGSERKNESLTREERRTALMGSFKKGTCSPEDLRIARDEGTITPQEYDAYYHTLIESWK